MLTGSLAAHTVGNSYSDGFRFWQGIAAMLGGSQLNMLMKDIYITNKGKPVSTAMIEKFLLSRSGNPLVVDAFHRFVYGLNDPTPQRLSAVYRRAGGIRSGTGHRPHRQGALAASAGTARRHPYLSAGIGAHPSRSSRHRSPRVGTQQPGTKKHISGAEHTRYGRILTSAIPDLIEARYPQTWEITFPSKGAAHRAFDIPPFSQIVMGLKLAVPRDAMPGQVIRLHFVQRSLATKRIIGGVSVQINVATPDEKRTKPR